MRYCESLCEQGAEAGYETAHLRWCSARSGRLTGEMIYALAKSERGVNGLARVKRKITHWCERLRWRVVKLLTLSK